MELKRVIALDSRAANEKAIQLYGENVLIISSERVDNQTELIVAVDLAPVYGPDKDEATDAATDKARNDAPATQAPVSTAPAGRARVHAPEVGILSFSDWLQQGVEPAAGASVRARQTPLKSPRSARPATAASAPGTSVPQAPKATLRPRPDPVPTVAPQVKGIEAVADETDDAELRHDQLRSREVLALVREEFDALRRELLTARAFAAAPVAHTPGDAAAREWMHKLADLGVPLALRTQLVADLDGSEDAGQVLAHLQHALVRLLERSVETRPGQRKAGRGGRSAAASGDRSDTGPRIEVLIGPSGCGKTSMAVRLAAQALADGGSAQAVVSFRDTRPGAWSQLQTLAAMAGVDCWRAQNAEALKVILAELGGHQTVWVDTGGLDYMDTAQVLHEICPQAALHAVLPLDASLTSSRRLLAESPVAWASLMLTKTDESGHAWPLISTLCEHPLPVSWLGAGAAVQMAARRFDAAELSTALLAPLGEDGPAAEPVATSAPVATAPCPDAQADARADAALALASSTLASLSRRATTTVGVKATSRKRASHPGAAAPRT